MSLAAAQTAFRDAIAAEDGAPGAESLGMAIYRNAYRARLVGALETSFEVTRRWCGEDAFGAAARHYVLTTPPVSWSLDDYGDAFPALLAELFRDDPEVAELAALEWRRQRAFAARDAATLGPEDLAAAGYGPEDWDRLVFAFAAGFTAGPVATDCVALWRALQDETPPGVAARAGVLLVWRVGTRPQMRIAPTDEGEMLARLAAGATLGEAAAACPDVARLGGWLAGWLGEGLFAAAAPRA